MNQPKPRSLLLIATTAACLLTTITPSVASPVFKPKRDCLNTVLDSIAQKKGTMGLKTKYESAARYNDEIFKKASDLSDEEWSRSVDDAIDHFADYDSRMDAEDFKKFVTKSPPSILCRELIAGCKSIQT